VGSFVVFSTSVDSFVNLKLFTGEIKDEQRLFGTQIYIFSLAESAVPKKFFEIILQKIDH
jgi:hypothetical protein